MISMNDELVLQEIMLPVINCHDDGKALFLIGQKVMIVGLKGLLRNAKG